MALEDIVNVSITAQTATPTRPGFGTPLFAVSKVPAAFTELVRTYSSLSGMIDDGFTTGDAAYLMAAAAFSQNPRVKKVKIGKRALPQTQVVTLTVLSATAGKVYNLTVDGTAITYTVPGSGSPTTTTVATAIAALIDAVSTVAATSSTATITVTASVAGTTFDISDWTTSLLNLKKTNTDPGIATDLAAILNEDSDWYGLAIDSTSAAEIVAAAAWVEANGKLAVFDSSDYDIIATGSGDVGSTLKTSAYARSAIMFSGNSTQSYASAAWLGNRFPFDPGSDTWMFKTLKGVPVTVLTDSQMGYALGKNVNVYTTIAGINMTQQGKSASGEFLDVTRFIDWLTAEIKVRVFAVLVNNQKIPYTDAGVDVIVSIVKGALQDGINVGGLAADPAPYVSAPAVADIDSVTKASRLLPDVTFTGTLAGAIHAVEINGTLSV